MNRLYQILAFLAIALGLSQSASAQMGNDYTIASNSGTGQYTEVKFCQHDAYAICSLIHNGKEMVDDFDHGRQIQTAASFDNKGEGYNPTEAGASYATNGYNPSPSHSQSLAVGLQQQGIRTSTKMAYWNPVAGVRLSKWTVDKNVNIVNGRHTQYLDYAVTMYSDATEPAHTIGQFEFLTGYMPAEFNKFYTVDVKGTRALASIAACTNYTTCSPEQRLPLIFANAAGTHAMGIYTLGLPQTAYPAAGYGRWNHTTERTTKWNSVFRYNNITPTTRYSYQGYVVIGTLANVQKQMQWLYDNGL